MSDWISTQMIFSRYNVENIQYLGINNINKIAFPMKCFCDINLHRLKKHVKNYGYYGLAFSKEWGMRNRVQAVQYINPDSELVEDISTILNPIFNLPIDENESEDMSKLKSYAIHQLMYYKPYSEGKQCFTDECEWRFIPKVPDGWPQFILNEQDMGNASINLLNSVIKQKEEFALPFKIEDIKYIIIKSEKDFNCIVQVIDRLKLNIIKRNRLLSKVIVWNASKEDF